MSWIASHSNQHGTVSRFSTDEWAQAARWILAAMAIDQAPRDTMMELHQAEKEAPFLASFGSDAFEIRAA